MKITGVDIKEYQQFKNLKFDFTYPKGHPKAGEPMDKVCLIGQSGTGKTTLLEMIYEYISDIVSNKNNFNISFDGDEFSNLIYVSDNTTEISLTSLQSVFDVKEDDKKDFDQVIGIPEDKLKIDLGRFVRLNSSFTNELIWSSIFREIHQYGIKIQSEFSKIITSTSSNQISSTLTKVVKWKEKNPDPKVDLAEKCINPILNKFYLEVDLENLEVPIAIKQKQNINRISLKKLSTGTKQILSTAIPIYKINTKKSIILFDEPERSLFPDLQREIIDYYTGLAPEAQFFFATHSPIIASAFEPCERFILYFDEEGNVKYRNGVAPIGDDPNDILSEDFEMMPLTNKKGVEAYQKWLNLANQIRNEKDEVKKEQLISERIKLGNLYNF